MHNNPYIYYFYLSLIQLANLQSGMERPYIDI